MKLKITLFLLCFTTLIFGQTLDQDVPYTSNNGGFVFTSPSFELGQTFTAGITDNLIQVNVWVYMNEGFIPCNGATNTVRLKIYSGEGNGGTMLGYSDNVEVGVQSCTETFFPFSTPIPIVSGNLYTMIFEEVANNCSQVVACMSNGGNPYANGRPWHQTAGFYEDRDVFLRTYVDASLSIEENNIDSKIRLHPNPFTDYISIDLGSHSDDITLAIWSVTGKIVLERKFNSASQITTNLDIEKGIYIAEITTNDGKKQYKKLIKN